MSKLSEVNYVYTTRIDFDNDFIELREPSNIELKEFGADSEKDMEILKKILPSCIIAHSFTDDNDEPSKNELVAKELSKSASLYMDILQTWIQSIPFTKRIKKNLDK